MAQQISGHLFCKRGVCLDETSIKQAFIRGAVRVVAQKGLENATTKAIAAEAKLNEAYIYKCFSGKDELLSTALLVEDCNFAELLHDMLLQEREKNCGWKQRAYVIWRKSWDFILEEKDDFLFYIRYYYSASCMMHAYRQHLEIYRPVIKMVEGSFKPGTYMEMLVHQIFSTMLFYGLRVTSGELPNNDETMTWVFDQIFNFVAPNVRPEFLQGEC